MMGFWSKLGKIASFAAPIVAAPFTGGASLAAIGAGAGAANAALNKQGVKGMLMGAGLGAIPGVSGMGKAASAAATSTGGQVANAAKQGLMGKMMAGGKQLLTSGDTMTALGRGLGSIGQTAAHNRGVKLDASMQADEMRMANDRARRDEEADIMKKLLHTGYLKAGGFKDMSERAQAGKPVSSKYDFGVRPATEAQIAASTELEKQLLGRMNNPRQLRDYDKMMDPGAMETIMNYAGPAASIWGAYKGGDAYKGPTAEDVGPKIAPPVDVFKPAPIGNPRNTGISGGFPTRKPFSNIFNENE
jgi:hypothetical protein